MWETNPTSFSLNVIFFFIINAWHWNTFMNWNVSCNQISCEMYLFGNKLLILWDFFISVKDKLFFQFENAAIFLLKSHRRPEIKQGVGHYALVQIPCTLNILHNLKTHWDKISSFEWWACAVLYSAKCTRYIVKLGYSTGPLPLDTNDKI